MSNYKKELTTAIEIVKKATEITEWFRKSGFEIYKKPDKSTVTIADFTSQIFLLSKIKESFPKDQIFAEENLSNFIDSKAETSIKKCFQDLNVGNISNYKSLLTYRGSSSQRQWNIDPIDGTIGFQENLTYAIGISLLVQNDPNICVISVPNYNKKDNAIFFAEKYQGAKATYRDDDDFKSVHVSNQKEIKKAKLVHSLHYDMPWVSQFVEIAGIKEHKALDSMAKLCMIADGSFDIYLKPITGFEASTWDYSPGDLLVREAGGKVSDLDEEKLFFQNEKCILKAPGIIATNGILHNEVSDLVRKNFFSIDSD